MIRGCEYQLKTGFIDNSTPDVTYLQSEHDKIFVLLLAPNQGIVEIIH
jgi:hypothetical protein